MMYDQNSNYSLLPFNQNTELVSTQFYLYLSITRGISSLLGTIFDLKRFFLEDDFLTHLNYIC
jgi:hypothetical protein